MQIIEIDELRPRLDRGKVIDAVRQALIWQAQGKVQSPLPGQLLFRQPPGDCHIKYGHVAGAAVRAQAVADNADVMLGHVLAGTVKPSRDPSSITVVDLTGIAAEDIAIAGVFSELLKV